MRELIVFGIVICLAGLALLRPRIGIYGYVWFALMRPDYFAWAVGHFPYSAVLSIGTLLGAGVLLSRVPQLFTHFTTCCLMFYQIPIGLSVVASGMPALTYEPYGEFERIMLMVMLIPVLITTEKDLRDLCLVIALSEGMIALKFGVYGLVRGGVHLNNGYAGLDNNGLALAIVMVLPFCWYVSDLIETRWLRGVLLLMAFSGISAVIMTKSRNGALAMLTTFLLITLRSRRKAGVVLLLVVLTAPAIYMFQDEFAKRMSTLEDVSADNSAMSRVMLAKAAIRVWRDYPVFGVGFGNDVFMAIETPYLEVSLDQSLKVHNTYLQVLVDSGIIAFVIFIVTLYGTIWKLGLSSRRWKHDPKRRVYPLMLQTSLLALAQYGFAGGRERYDFLYILLTASTSWFIVERQLRREQLEISHAAAPPQPAWAPRTFRPAAAAAGPALQAPQHR